MAEKCRSKFGTTKFQSYSAHHDRVIKRPAGRIEKVLKHKCPRPRTGEPKEERELQQSENATCKYQSLQDGL